MRGAGGYPRRGRLRAAAPRRPPMARGLRARRPRSRRRLRATLRCPRLPPPRCPRPPPPPGGRDGAGGGGSSRGAGRLRGRAGRAAHAGGGRGHRGTGGAVLLLPVTVGPVLRCDKNRGRDRDRGRDRHKNRTKLELLPAPLCHASLQGSPPPGWRLLLSCFPHAVSRACPAAFLFYLVSKVSLRGKAWKGGTSLPSAHPDVGS